MVATRLQGDIGGCADHRFCRIGEGFCFGMRATRHLMKSLPNDPALSHQDATHTRIRVRCKPALLCKPKSLREKCLVHHLD